MPVDQLIEALPESPAPLTAPMEDTINEVHVAVAKTKAASRVMSRKGRKHTLLAEIEQLKKVKQNSASKAITWQLSMPMYQTLLTICSET